MKPLFRWAVRQAVRWAVLFPLWIAVILLSYALFFIPPISWWLYCQSVRIDRKATNP